MRRFLNRHDCGTLRAQGLHIRIHVVGDAFTSTLRTQILGARHSKACIEDVSRRHAVSMAEVGTLAYSTEVFAPM